MSLTRDRSPLNLIKTTEATLANDNEIREGTLYFTTDTKKIYADLDNSRSCFSCIQFGNSLTELLEKPKMKSVLYWNRGNNKGYVYINNTLTEVIDSNVVHSITLSVVNSLQDITDLTEDYIYAVPTNDSLVNNHYELYIAVGNELVKMSTGVSGIQQIANNAVNTALNSLETELAAIRDSLRAGTIDESDYYDQIAAFYQNVYNKNQSYSSSQIDTLLNNLKNEILAQSIPTVNHSKTSTGTTIYLENNISFYRHNMSLGSTITIDTSNLVLASGDVISFELLLTGANNRRPIYNPQPTWVDGAAPTYYNNTVIGFRSFDSGANWLAYYQGGWN